MRLLLRLLRWLGIGLAALVLALSLFAAERFISLRRSLPSYGGTIADATLNEPAEIVRDGRAIPHIEAKSWTDAAFALGVAHGQDRLWQMMILRRAGQGRLAEIFGPPAVPVDKTVRSVGLTRLAQTNFGHLSAEVQGLLRAYAAGINTQVVGRDRPLPPEFTLLWTEAEPWSASDSLILMSLLSVGLSSNVFTELSRVALSAALPAERIADLFAPAPGLPAGVDLSPFQAKPENTARNAALATVDLPLGASNNWVVDGTRSMTGAPLLANDPHLGLQMPGLWYLVHLRVGGRSAVGASLPGVPAILLGHTDDLAWGMTNTGTDVQDLVLERVDPDNPNAYLTPDGPRPFETRTETIRVRFGADVTHTVRRTRNGPVIDLLQDRAPEGHVWAVKWTADTPINRTLHVSTGILTARSIEQIRPLIADYVAPTQNFVFADRQGAIGFVAAGAVPARADDVPGRGLVPVAGWRHGQIWEGMLDPADWPQVWQPASGALATANSDIRPEGYPHLITEEWSLPFRTERIETLLADRPLHDLDSFAAIMNDHRTGLRGGLLARMLDLTPRDDDLAQALDAMRGWDGMMSGERAEPLMMVAWLGALTDRLAADDLAAAGEAGEAIAGRLNPVFVLDVLNGRARADHWCDDGSTPVREDCPAVLAASLRAGLTTLERRFGTDRSAWRWGAAHGAVHSHLPFGFVPVLKALFNRRVETAGGTYTVSRGSYRLSGPDQFTNVHGGGYRALYDVGRPERSRFMIATGQSGNPYSEHYDDLVAPWGEGAFFTIERDLKSVRAQGAGSLRLVPADAVQ